ncbi:MAG: class I SAM-dependent methyltransferase [Oscillospiraceae bacterium]|nr:class I SAM-dependent methyltransferase [Oscillospiraceae bacterium]
MDVVQKFYNELAPRYDRLFDHWPSAVKEQGDILDRLFKKSGFDASARILDCACGIGTQAIGLASVGYDVTASDISEGALTEAKKRAAENGVDITFIRADFRALEETFSEQFDVVMAMDNALPHMLTAAELKTAVSSITDRIAPGGMFVASIRDYDALMAHKPPYSPPYIHKTAKGQRVAFQTWDWQGEGYKLVQYIIEDEENLHLSRFECEYRATLREELTDLLHSKGCSKVEWLFPEETGFYQPVVTAKKMTRHLT